MLLNSKRFGKMRGMGEMVKWSIRDESWPWEGMNKRFREFWNEHQGIVNDDFKGQSYCMVRAAVALENKVIDWTEEMGDIEGWNAQEGKDDIRERADRRLSQLGWRGNYNIKENPGEGLTPWIATKSHDNCLETQVTEYNANGLAGEGGWQ